MWKKVSSECNFDEKQYYCGWYDCFGEFFQCSAVFDKNKKAFVVSRDFYDDIIHPQYYIDPPKPENNALFSCEISCLVAGVVCIYHVYFCQSENECFDVLFSKVGRLPIVGKQDIPTDMLQDVSKPVVKLPCGAVI